MTNEKTLFFDIETTPCIALVWGGGKQYISYNQIIKDRKIISIAYMWRGETKVKELHFNLSKHDNLLFDDDADKEMLIKFSKEYNKADLVVAHNGKKFDIERLTARLFKYQLPPLRSTLVDDTYSMSKKLGTTFKKLDWLSKVSGLGQKLDVGLSHWIEICWKKNRGTLKELIEYNKKDVLLLAELYEKLLPYANSTLNRSLLKGDKSCVDCGNPSLRSNGFKVTRTGKYRVYKCNSCGSCKTTDRRSMSVSVVK